MKQQKSPNKGEWVWQIINNSINNEQFNEDFIRNTPKEEYSKYMKLKVKKAAFTVYLQMKESQKNKKTKKTLRSHRQKASHAWLFKKW